MTEYLTRAERRAIGAKLRELGREMKKEIFALALSIESGSAPYSSRADTIEAAAARVRAVYLRGEG